MYFTLDQRESFQFKKIAEWQFKKPLQWPGMYRSECY